MKSSCQYTMSRSLAIYTLVSCLLSTVFLGCGTKAGQGPVKHFPLTLALSGPIGENGSRLPDDAKALLMPVQVKNCAGILFIPDVKIIRLDIEGSQASELDLGQ